MNYGMHPTDAKLFERGNLTTFSKTLIAAAWAFFFFTCFMRLVSPGMFFAITNYCLDWMYP
jgi:hypothetical protein